MFSLAVSLMSVFVAILIFEFQLRNKAIHTSIFLTIFFITYGIYGISHYVMQESSSSTLYAIFFNNFTPLYILMGPSLYLYVKKTINDEPFILHKKDAIHLIGFIIVFFDLTPYIFRSFSFKIQLAESIINDPSNFKTIPHLFFSDYWASILRQSVNLFYLLMCTRLVFKPNLRKLISNKQKVIVSIWLKILAITMTLFFLFMLIYLLSLRFQFSYNNLEIASELFLKITWYTHGFIILIVFFFPSILYGIPQLNAANVNFNKYNERINKNEAIVIENKKIYKTFELDNNYLEEIHLIIETYIKSAPFVQDKFSLSVLTTETKIPTHHLNLYFKNYLNTSFNVWKNKLKIDYALNLINSGILNQITIEGVALKSGFKSYSNFFTTFKNQTGISPSDYIEKQID
jgi:AraC-like DNA-binding protein